MGCSSGIALHIIKSEVLPRPLQLETPLSLT
jgi:hypothetical protein